MAHYAKIENGIVTNVIVADQEFVDKILCKLQDKYLELCAHQSGKYADTQHSSCKHLQMTRDMYRIAFYTYLILF